MFRTVASLIGVALMSLRGELPKAVSDAFAKTTEFDLYSLDPGGGEGEEKGPDAFHGWKVLGKIVVKDDVAKKIREGVQKGIAENKDAKGACFMPRHGIRIKSANASYDLVICFQCLQIYVYEGEKEIGWSLTSNSPTELLNKVLSDAKVPLPKK